MILLVPNHQYNVYRYPIDIVIAGKSQLGLQSSQNATTARGLTRGHTELHYSYNYSPVKGEPKRCSWSVYGLYKGYLRYCNGRENDYLRNREEGNKNMKNKEETYREVPRMCTKGMEVTK